MSDVRRVHINGSCICRYQPDKGGCNKHVAGYRQDSCTIRSEIWRKNNGGYLPRCRASCAQHRYVTTARLRSGNTETYTYVVVADRLRWSDMTMNTIQMSVPLAS